jgi:hypothetical protein
VAPENRATSDVLALPERVCRRPGGARLTNAERSVLIFPTRLPSGSQGREERDRGGKRAADHGRRDANQGPKPSFEAGFRERPHLHRRQCPPSNSVPARVVIARRHGLAGQPPRRAPRIRRAASRTAATAHGKSRLAAVPLRRLWVLAGACGAPEGCGQRRSVATVSGRLSVHAADRLAPDTSLIVSPAYFSGAAERQELRVRNSARWRGWSATNTTEDRLTRRRDLSGFSR